MKLKIGTKIYSGYAIVLLLVTIIGLAFFSNTKSLINDASWVQHTNQVRFEISKMLSTLKDAETGERGYTITGEEAFLEPYNSARDSVESVYARLRSLISDNKNQIRRCDSLRLFINEELTLLDSVVNSRKNKGFQAAQDVIKTNIGKAKMDRIRLSINRMMYEENNLLLQRSEKSDATARRTLNIVEFGIPVLILLLILLGILITRNISVPLTRLTGFAKLLGEGDLSIKIPFTKRSDEIGDLLRVFNKMIETNREQIREITEGVNILASSANQILASTTQIASGSSETAVAISETSTTVEEVRQAAQLSGAKANGLSESTKHVSQVSMNGKKAVDETMEGMNHIKNQMDKIALTVIKLSEQTQSIGGIIASVTDLADQSNLLAVNAAIEAAKAGDQGKGFAVVAQEIRNLAEQSKQATLQVRNILNDIQKATGEAVLATEQGSKAVEAGNQQSKQAGEAIRQLAESIKEAAQVSSQIAASSQQQIIGMDQIGLAMQNINQAGAENASSMTQTEQSVKNLHDLGQKLKELVEQYKI